MRKFEPLSLLDPNNRAELKRREEEMERERVALCARLVGKTIAAVEYDYFLGTITFTDGTSLVIKPEDDGWLDMGLNLKP